MIDLLNLIFPPRCIFCDSLLTAAGKRFFCNTCSSALPYVKGKICQKCGTPLDYSNKHELCATCKSAERTFEKNFSVFTYEGMVSDAVLRMKRENIAAYFKEFAHFMEIGIRYRFENISFDFVTFVPSTKAKMRKRGYNQGTLLAKELSRLSGIPFEGNLLKKTKETSDQKELSEAQRAENLKGAFEITDIEKATEIKGKTILLIDDVFTTGATLNEIAGVLVKSGAASVYTATVATTCLKKSS